jgi:hypothetical protein
MAKIQKKIIGLEGARPRGFRASSSSENTKNFTVKREETFQQI